MTMGKELPPEVLANMIETNQVAIKQLGADLKDLHKKMAHKELNMDEFKETMRRDIADKCQFISDLTKEFEKLTERVQELESKKTKT